MLLMLSLVVVVCDNCSVCLGSLLQLLLLACVAVLAAVCVLFAADVVAVVFCLHVGVVLADDDCVCCYYL